jgi:hypothetical protein
LPDAIAPPHRTQHPYCSLLIFVSRPVNWKRDGHFYCHLVEIVCHLWKRMLLGRSFETKFGSGRGGDNVNIVACVQTY